MHLICAYLEQIVITSVSKRTVLASTLTSSSALQMALQEIRVMSRPANHQSLKGLSLSQYWLKLVGSNKFKFQVSAEVSLYILSFIVSMWVYNCSPVFLGAFYTGCAVQPVALKYPNRLVSEAISSTPKWVKAKTSWWFKHLFRNYFVFIRLGHINLNMCSFVVVCVSFRNSYMLY